MEPADTAFSNLAGIFPEIVERRKADPILDEICRDFESLTTMAESTKTSTDEETGNLQKDLRITIRALQEEIRVRLNKPNP